HDHLPVFVDASRVGLPGSVQRAAVGLHAYAVRRLTEARLNLNLNVCVLRQIHCSRSAVHHVKAAELYVRARGRRPNLGHSRICCGKLGRLAHVDASFPAVLSFLGHLTAVHAFASSSRLRKAASPASDILTHFGSGDASAW